MLPLITKPIYKTAIWAGNKLSERFGVKDMAVSEAWVLSLRPGDCSEVINPPYTGLTLDKIEPFCNEKEDFPLLVKLIDAALPLSVQVHPDDAYAKSKGMPRGKTEVWHVLEAQPGAQLICGLKPYTNPEQLLPALESGTAEQFLNGFPVQPGDSFFIPAGMVHAIGGGILIAEIQQNSDTTYRLYDYNRTDAQGKKRQLHVQDALNCLKPELAPVRFEAPVIAQCDSFETKKLRCDGTVQLDGQKMQHILITDGEGKIFYGNYGFPARRYTSILIPKGCEEFSIAGQFDYLLTVTPS